MGQTALHNAVTVGYRDVVSLLIKHGADVNLSAGAESHHGEKDMAESQDNLAAGASSPLEIACHQGDLEMLKLLLSNGAEDIDHRCLNSAIRADNTEVIMILLQRGNLLRECRTYRGSCISCFPHTFHTVLKAEKCISCLLLDRQPVLLPGLERVRENEAYPKF